MLTASKKFMVMISNIYGKGFYVAETKKIKIFVNF